MQQHTIEELGRHLVAVNKSGARNYPPKSMPKSQLRQATIFLTERMRIKESRR